VYELGVDQLGRSFLCMKLIEGATLDDVLSRRGEGRLDPHNLAEFLQVFVKVCDAVSFAHSRGVLHRDLKPSNIMVSDFGQVYVLDWGIARVRAAPTAHTGPRVRVSEEHGAASDPDAPGSLIGTACYMAPEQLRGLHDRLDERTDVFALGATLYQILTGQPPLTPGIVRAIWMNQPPPSISTPEERMGGGRVPAELSRIAMRALSIEPDARYAAVADLKHDVEAFQRGAWDLPRVRCVAGAAIIREGDAGDAAYVVLEGTCVAHRGDSYDTVLRTMGPGDVFGETAVFTQKPRSASVSAATDVTLVVVTGDVLSKALGLNSWMGTFVRALADRFREADQKLRLLAGASDRDMPSSTPLGSAAEVGVPPKLADLVKDPEALARVTAHVPRRTVAAGATVIVEGQPNDAAFVILKGSCADSHRKGVAEIVRRVLGPGDVFGEGSAISAKPATSSVRAVTDVELLVVDRRALSGSLGLHSWMGAFVRALAERLREADERLRDAQI
jgi:serine/threonine-protein kinase